eukprot:6203779-Pleurochrysis_carterae.AAC.3
MSGTHPRASCSSQSACRLRLQYAVTKIYGSAGLASEGHVLEEWLLPHFHTSARKGVRSTLRDSEYFIPMIIDKSV